MKDQLLIPHLTEKTYSLAKDSNIYVFKADPKLNQNQIKDILQKEYKVEIINIRTLILKGKKARSIRLRSKTTRRVIGRRKDVKKAYITLKTGDSIPIFVDAITQDKTT